ncbi:putative MFS transporter [Thermoascus aurantiacus ATCC 26904]
MFTKNPSSTDRPLEQSAPTPSGRDERAAESTDSDDGETHGQQQPPKELEKKLRLKVDLRLCTIAGILCSLNLLDSGIISSASVTSMLSDLDLEGNRYSVSIFIFTVASVVFQLPSTLAVRFIGPRIWFAFITFCFGLITLCTAFVRTWQQMIVLRVLLGVSMSGIYPGLTYLISTWYTRQEQQLRFAFLQSGEVLVLATGGIVNYGLNHLDGRAGLAGWRWMFLVQGLVTCTIGIVTYWWMVDFPENAQRSFYFLSESEALVATRRIQVDRDDVVPEPFSWSKVLVHFLDPKIYGFCCLFFLLNLVSTSLSYFLPIILQSGMGFSTNKSILLSAPPYYYAIIPVLLTSLLGDTYRIRGPLITLNALCLIAGFLMFGLPASTQVAVRYVGTFLATGAYVSNWAALNAYQANNVVGQWKRATTAAAVTACNGLGGIAGSFIVRQREAPEYQTAVWVSIGSHILMISIVAAFTVHLYIANRRQTRGRVTLEGVVSWQTLPSVPLKNSIKILSRSGLTWLLTYESHLQPGFRYTY